MMRNWLNRASSIASAVSNADRQKAIKIFAAAICVLAGGLCMWQNSQSPYSALGPDLLAESDESVLPPAPTSDFEVANPSRTGRMLPAVASESTLDQLVIHVDKHGNIDVAGELINTDVFRNLLHMVKEDSTGDVSVLIHANKYCEVSTLQKVVDVCEECLTQYRLRIEENRTQSKPDKPSLTGRA